MKKIEKLEGSYDVPQLKQKLNEIIDYLNTQPQAEENTVCEGCGKTITSRFMQSYTKGDGMHSYCLSCDPEKQDIPEQKEEWEEEFMEVLETFKDEICSNFFASSKPLTNFIKQLLSERETKAKREVLERILENIPVCRNLNGYEGEGWIMEDDLRNISSKLNKKK